MTIIPTLFKRPEQFIDSLTRQLQHPLPGRDAQLRMAPQGRNLMPSKNLRPRESAVLVLNYPADHEIMLALTVRQQHLHQHSGEICFPGGAADPSDADFNQTALRETEEEIGLPADQVEIIGALTELYIPPSNHLVHPYVGWLPHPPHLHLNQAEVARFLEIPLSQLLQPETICYRWRAQDHRTSLVPYYQFEGLQIWGATAMILSEYLLLVEQVIEKVLVCSQH